MKKLSLDQLPELFSAISGSRALYLPLEQNGEVRFGRWTAERKVRLDALHTARSAKDLFFPQSEDLVAFRTEGKKISIVENREKSAPFAVFGVRACDARSFEILDRVFLAKPADTFYKARRDNGVVLTLACGEPEETCFCTAFGIDPAEPGGDVETWITGGFLYWKSRTEKGEALTRTVGGLLEPADDAAAEACRKDVRALMSRLPLNGFSPAAVRGKTQEELFSSPEWERLSETCLGCGVCTFVCPTCQCYDIRDYDTGHGVQRFRCWDSCMYTDFTKMSAGNPRKTQRERFRQRFMHKLVYFPENNGGIDACVGCGRCLAKCPVSMNIVKVVKALGGSAND